MNEITIQRQVPAKGLPAANSLRAFAQAALPKRFGELTIRLVDETESQALNKQYRGKDKPTNVLSFQGDAVLAKPILGDLVICAPLVAREALEQNKSCREHWAHLVVHGCLHLQGYDHELESEARAMEAREVRILQKLGFADPYGDR